MQPQLARRREIDVPLHELREPLDPATPIEPGVPLGLNGAKPLHERAGQRLRADERPLENARDDREDLARRDRLHEVIADVRADRFLERRVFFALGDHHDRHGRQHLADVLVGIQPAGTGHLLVEQHQIVRAPSQKLERVIRVRRRFDVIALVCEQESMRLEKLRFVVHPKNRFCHQRHTRKVPERRDLGPAASAARRRQRDDRPAPDAIGRVTFGLCTLNPFPTRSNRSASLSLPSRRWPDACRWAEDVKSHWPHS